MTAFSKHRQVLSYLSSLAYNDDHYMRDGALGGPDLFIILLIVLVLFGSKKLPDLARSLGQSMNEFRKAREDEDY